MNDLPCPDCGYCPEHQVNWCGPGGCYVCEHEWPTTHAVYRVVKTRETDSVCTHNAPGPWVSDLENVSCKECLRIIAERTNRQIDRLHGPGAAAALDEAIADGSIFGEDPIALDPFTIEVEFCGESCPRTKFPDGTHCGEYGWHAINCPERENI
jgi:hypothetical protein